MQTLDISGFGGGYEATCQKMLLNGERFLEAHHELKEALRYKGFESVYGIRIPEGDAAEQLDKAIVEGIDDATGAMHHAVVGHLLYIAKLGREKWVEEGSEHLGSYELDEVAMETEILLGRLEFELQTGRLGESPTLKLLRETIAPEDWIRVDVQDEESVRSAIAEIRQRLQR